MSDIPVEVRGLRKSYGRLEAVRGIDLTIERGEVFALVGPNGAGKTTTVEILEGFRRRTAGEVKVLGHDPEKADRALRNRVGIVLQSTGVDRFLTVRETVQLYAGYYPNPRSVDEVIEVVGLTEKRDIKVLRLSGGQQRRLDVAIALAGDPELLFLDEPTTGFDPGARRNAWEVVRNLSSLGKTVFLTTHYMDEAENLANRVAVISSGEIVAEGPPRSLGEQQLSETVIRFRLLADAGELPSGIGIVLQTNGSVEVRTQDPTRALHELTSWALECDTELLDLRVTKPTLEEVFLELTGGQAGTE
jgi:ABC-2 type transport system ATP-binding protein